MRAGRLRIVTLPLSTVTVAGNGFAAPAFGAASDGAASASARTASAAARAIRRDMACFSFSLPRGGRGVGERQVF
jgi:hypothetical protein